MPKMKRGRGSKMRSVTMTSSPGTAADFRSVISSAAQTFDDESSDVENFVDWEISCDVEQDLLEFQRHVSYAL